MMNIIRLYIYPLFLGFVIVPLLVWPMVVALAACIITLSFLGEMLFSIPLMIRRISLLQLQLWLSAEYALFFCVMCCVGWQFTRRTQSELKSRLHCWLVFAPVYLWLILWNIIFYIAPAKIALLESIRNFFLLVVWLPLNFSPFWPQPWTDFIGPISAQLGFALGYYCQWCSKNRCQIRKLSEWGTCLSFVAKSGEITRWLNYICAALLLIVLAIFYCKIHLSRKQQVNTTQESIEKRQKLAALRISSHLLGWGYLALAITFTTQLYWEQIASRPPQLSEAIPLTLDEKQQVHIPIEQVKDGKLHRFVWIADDGKAVRFFVINRQPDKLSLAAVFDACLLCGDQGYVMEGNQVVCVGCGVHMFIPSIGKPGGCNPVPIEDWQQTETEILTNRTSLEEGLNLFSTIVEIDVKDPISGTQMKNTKTEHKYNYEGKTYFFESEKNLDLFRDNPEKYLGKGE